MRRKEIENLSLTGKVECKKARGRQRMTYLSNIKDWTNRTNGNELMNSFKLVKIEKFGGA